MVFLPAFGITKLTGIIQLLKFSFSALLPIQRMIAQYLGKDFG